MKTISQIREASGGKEAYQKFFNSLLKKFGVSSPSELKGDKKKEFFDAIDKGWDGDNEKAESVKEASKLKGGRGKAEIDINWDGDRKDAKFAATKYKIKLKPTSNGAILSGDKQKILAYLQGQDYDMDPEDIEDLYPELMETYDDEDDLDPESTLNPDENPLATGKSLGEANSAQLKKAQAIASKNSGDMEAAIAEIEKIKKGLSNDKKVMAMLKTANESVSEAKKLSARAQFKAYVDKYDIKAYGMKNPDEAKKVIQFIFNAYKGSLTPEMMNDLVKDGSFFKNGIKANLKFGYNDWESTHFSGGLWIQKADYASIIKKNTGLKESFQEAVSVDRRTVGFKEAMKRAKEAKAKREAAKIKAAKTQSKTDMANIDANYAYDGDIEEILTSANKKIMGQHEDAAANASSSGAVDMNPTGKPKKKEKENLMAKYGY